MRCSACWSTFESWEAVKGRCPYCFPRQIKRVRSLTEDELTKIIDAGCPEGHGPWATVMGAKFCKTCGLLPPTYIRFQ